MTAEIVIMNKHGVALAADSAVSIGTKKVYNSANKLFALSKEHPVGIMIYGSAEFLGTPWETIIKHYRARELKGKSFPTLQEHAVHFIEYLGTAAIFPEDAERMYLQTLFHGFCSSILHSIEQRLQAAVESDPVTVQDIEFQIGETLRRIVTHTDTLTQSVLLKEDIRARILSKFKREMDEIIASVFERLPLTDEHTTHLKSSFIAYFGSFELETEPHTGIVIAGFGEDEIFPHMDSFRVQGRVEGFLRMENCDSDTAESSSAVISPFAQREMVDMFMQGADPTCMSTLIESFGQVLRDLPGLLVEKYGLQSSPIQEHIKQDLEEIGSGLKGFIEQYQRENFIQPVLESVGALPLDELSSMAESLVNLTSFKRKVTMVQESVGGPIDVAVISKGDGFIWINRKHYFSPELNHHYFANTKREINA